MTRVGWLVDDLGITVGGAELSQAEFRAVAPGGVEVIDCPAGGVVPGLDRYVLHNIVTYGLNDLQAIDGPAFKYHHDVGPHIRSDVWDWLGHNAQPICCSPLQAKRMKLDAVLIPPAINLEAFRKAAESAGERSGAVCVGPWMGAAKAPDAAAEWAAGNGGISFVGGGMFAPPSAFPVSPEHMPEVLARFQTFVHLPRELEPFGRAVVEAWAAGCDIVVNGLVGARYWITEEPDKLETAASDFWDLCTS